MGFFSHDDREFVSESLRTHLPYTGDPRLTSHPREPLARLLALSYLQVYNNDPQGDPNAHEAKWSHELIGGAAGFEAMKGEFCVSFHSVSRNSATQGKGQHFWAKA